MKIFRNRKNIGNRLFSFINFLTLLSYYNGKQIKKNQKIQLEIQNEKTWI